MLSIFGSERRLHWLSALATAPALVLALCVAGAAEQLQGATATNTAIRTGVKVFNPNTPMPIPAAQSECSAIDLMWRKM